MRAPVYERDGIVLYHGDMRDILPGLQLEAHAAVTDPPYGLSFMGKGWDKDVPGVPFWEALKGVLLPGAHLLAFGGSRTQHRMGVAVEDAGFELRDTLMWLYGQGFPKGTDISKAIDRAAGAERERRIVATKTGNSERRGEGEQGPTYGDAWGGFRDESAPATPEAAQWDGWNTQLKPSYEPIILARKPMTGTVAANVLTHGTGAINVDACRIGFASDADKATVQGATWYAAPNDVYGKYGAQHDRKIMHGADSTPDKGRWPANVLLDEAAAEALDAQSGVSKSGTAVRHRGVTNKVAYGGNIGRLPEGTPDMGYGDTGGASRFFPVLPVDDPDTLRFRYQSKASRRERNAGLEGMPERDDGAYANGAGMPGRTFRDGEWVQTGSWQEPNRKARQNHHPTVKPVALMEWLLRLVTPPGGLVIDPFAGSGTTGVACVKLGVPCILIEESEQYVPIIIGRIEQALNDRTEVASELRQGVLT